ASASLRSGSSSTTRIRLSPLFASTAGTGILAPGGAALAGGERPPLSERARQVDGEERSFLRLALDLDRAAQRIHDLADNPEPQAAPPVGPVRAGALDPLEDLRRGLGGDADAMVADRQPRPRVIAGDGDFDRPARPVLDGVGEQVRHALLDAHAVPLADEGAR